MRPRVLLVGPRGHGGEEVYIRTLVDNPPLQAIYVQAGDFHQGAPGAPSRILEEVLLNRLLHRVTVPDMGFRALDLRGAFDLIHVHAHPARLSRLGSTPLVMSEGSSSAVYLQEYLNWDTPRLRRGYARSRWLYRRLGIHDRLLNLEHVARAYVFSSWARGVNIRWGADPDKIEVVYPGFPTPRLVDRSDRDTFTFLFVGTDFERKGGYEVLAAFASLSPRYPEARLHIISHDPQYRNPDRIVHSWVQRSERVRLGKAFDRLRQAGVATWQPLLGRSALYSQAYPAADAFAMPSHAEGFGFTNVEAMSFGLPVISAETGPIPEVVKHGVTGFLVPAGDVDALTLAMERLLVDPPLARALGAAARADFLQRFTLERFRSEVGRVYRLALQSTKSPG